MDTQIFSNQTNEKTYSVIINDIHHCIFKNLDLSPYNKRGSLFGTAFLLTEHNNSDNSDECIIMSYQCRDPKCLNNSNSDMSCSDSCKDIIYKKIDPILKDTLRISEKEKYDKIRDKAREFGLGIFKYKKMSNGDIQIIEDRPQCDWRLSKVQKKGIIACVIIIGLLLIIFGVYKINENKGKSTTSEEVIPDMEVINNAQ